ncbi:MAG: Uma2 family endonuclease [Drouetiella hepatica Uher 2000/2452]|jgi:Uma2 family endonuclease|uniref:Uma2 family endonuclease n=1 Tax=Drouetiella hepatica Uher 2000/2452 TaxID=904376 RepID=A0A951UM99_9CYAN|nr:Uma2 family endonuclease [Drouetiella hepatica Uher 2000/2452]
MVSQLQTADVFYPDSDGQPMADNTEQFRWIVVIQQNLEWIFTDSTVFVAGDLLWYPVQGNREICTAPDVLIAFDRPKGKRGSYKQWEENNIAPQVVFEILSPSNTKAEMNRKLLFYHTYGVEEYYLYDPETNALSGWLRSDGFLDVIEPIAHWVSPRLGVRFDCETSFKLYRPDGKPFLSYSEIAQQVAHLEEQLEQERQRTERLAEYLRSQGIDPDQVP